MARAFGNLFSPLSVGPTRLKNRIFSNRHMTVSLGDRSGETHMIGDCLCPRTVEEAVLEGLRVGTQS